MLCYIGVGSNLGDRLGYMRKAVAILRKMPGILVGKISPIYETPAEGGPEGQEDYLNLVAEIETELLPVSLLAILKTVEKKTGRKTRPDRWAAREIDLDILLCGSLEIKEDGLVLPHPMAQSRYFVLKPLSDLAPCLVFPGASKDISAMLADGTVLPKGEKFEETL